LSALELTSYLQEKQRHVETLLQQSLARFRSMTALPLADAMAYALLAQSKRLRPIWCLAFAEAVSASSASKVTQDAACALEWVHTYSLIHDDLPAMDDDDLRRGQLTSHKKFGEAHAILAGDALLTGAFELLSGEGEEPLRLKRELSSAAGALGMV
jgi:geranylgeranyl diphosphate synthase, type II